MSKSSTCTAPETFGLQELWFATDFEFVFADWGTLCWNLRYAFVRHLSEGD
ncbi:MAG TPA: hypothetical protein VK692_01785 [Chthoniobacterales bacterium]|nr:hypothetical protein [Chthoniobacterales bacterium]